jgi:hypothetical protein
MRSSTMPATLLASAPRLAVWPCDRLRPGCSACLAPMLSGKASHLVSPRAGRRRAPAPRPSLHGHLAVKVQNFAPETASDAHARIGHRFPCRVDLGCCDYRSSRIASGGQGAPIGAASDAALTLAGMFLAGLAVGLTLAQAYFHTQAGQNPCRPNGKQLRRTAHLFPL